MTDKRYVDVLALLFIVLWIALAIEPLFRRDWALENGLVLPFGFWFMARRRRIRVSKFHASLIFLFLSLHEIGAHYTYSEVPYEEWTKCLFGTGLNEFLGLERNHFDRLLHFLFGLLLTPPLGATIARSARFRGALRHFVPAAFIISLSMFYEILEWWVAEIFGGDLGVAYLGTQGDQWDAQKDGGLAALGALLAAFAGWIVSRAKSRG